MAPNTSPRPQLNQLMVSVVNDIKAALLALVLQIGSNFLFLFLQLDLAQIHVQVEALTSSE